MTNRWHRAIGFALTGIDLDLAPQATPDLDALVVQMRRDDAQARAILDLQAPQRASA